MKALLHSLLEAATLGRPVVLCTVVHSGGSAPRSAGAHMAVFADGSTRGTVGGGRLELLAAKEGLSFLQRQTSALRAYDLSEREGGIGRLKRVASEAELVDTTPQTEQGPRIHDVLRTLADEALACKGPYRVSEDRF